MLAREEGNKKKKGVGCRLSALSICANKKDEDNIEIVVHDNGNGIPETIPNKIFQPFFTTKPTGKGTGMGLSLAYDIITKEHNGAIAVESKRGEFSSFRTVIPCS